MTITMKAPGYAETAYRSNRKVPTSTGTSQQSAIFRKSWTMGPPLPKGRLSGLAPPGFLDTWDPKRLRDYEKMDDGKGTSELDERHTYHGRLDEECLRYTTLPKVSWVLLWMQHGGRLIFLWLFPLFLLVAAFGWTQESESVSFSLYFWDGISPFILFLFGPLLLCWAVGHLLEKKYPQLVYQEPKGPLWELNRRTGMVTLFKNPEKAGQSGEIRGQAPFHEWDGYLLNLPDQQGNVWHRLVLVHKAQEWALPLNQLVAATPNKEDVLAFWDLIRQYMDVSKPLPDIPLFEAYRHLDPTTRAHDEKEGRDPQYWRNMDDETYESFKRRNQTELLRYKWR